MASECQKCESVHLPPRPVCPDCGGDEMGWAELEGRGRVRAFSVINVPLTKMEECCPYTVAVVELDGGPSISGQVLDVHDGDAISVGDRVIAEFVEKGGETILCFKLV